MTSVLLISLNLVLLQGTLTVSSDFSISVPKQVFVQQNLCADVPCKFTVPKWYSQSSSPFYIYWFKIVYKQYYLVWVNLWVLGDLMATNDLRQKADVTNIKLTGDPKKGDCSFSIANALLNDWGKYYLRIDKGEAFRYAFLPSDALHHIIPQIVVTDLKKPVIWKPSHVIWGEPVIFSCLVSDSCSKPKPQISWSFKSSNSTISYWAIQHSNWTWTYGINLSFIPSLPNEGLILTCYVRYPTLKKLIKNAIQLHMAHSPEVVVIHKCQYNGSATICSCAFHSWPPPEIQWQMDMMNLTRKNISDHIKITSSTKGNIGISSLYLIGMDTSSHTISCRGINPIGSSILKFLSTPAKIRKVTKVKYDHIPGILLGLLLGLLVFALILYFYSVNFDSCQNVLNWRSVR
ncbi:sialic acid-binding Ig-like lectin 14 [Liasis olivaceus]